MGKFNWRYPKKFYSCLSVITCMYRGRQGLSNKKTRPLYLNWDRSYGPENMCYFCGTGAILLAPTVYYPKLMRCRCEKGINKKKKLWPLDTVGLVDGISYLNSKLFWWKTEAVENLVIAFSMKEKSKSASK